MVDYVQSEIINRVGKIASGDKYILLVDLSDVTNDKIDQLELALNTSRRIIDKEAPKSVRIMADVSRATEAHSINKKIVEWAKLNTPYVLASAVVGATGAKALVVKTVAFVTKRNIRIFDTIPEAAEWLFAQ